MKLMIMLLAILGFSASAEPAKVVDIAGRTVKINLPVNRVIVGDSRLLMPLNILHPADPLKGIVAWDDAFIKKSPDIAKEYRAKNIQVDKIPVFPNPYQSDFSVEVALQYKPDLIIFDTGILARLQQLDVLTQLDKVGIPVVFVDFRQQPVKNTVPSMRLLGEIFSEQEHAKRFIDFYNSRLQLIRQRVNEIPQQDRPVVFIERHAGLMANEPCCVTFGTGGVSEFVREAGGRNLGDQWFSGMGGQINQEQMIVSDPDFYLMTAADWRGNVPKSQSVPLGYFADKKEVVKYYDHLVNRPVIKTLSSIKEKKALALYHQYYDLPFNIVAIEVIAKFIYPDKFKDIDPVQDNLYLHKNFTSIEPNGIFWFSERGIDDSQ